MLNGIPNVDIPRNLQAAISAGRRMTSILREVVSLRRGPGNLTANEYFYYRLWDPALSAAEKRRFVGKQAQHQMHLACNDPGWYAAAADKLLFQILMAGSMFPVGVDGPLRHRNVPGCDVATTQPKEPSE
jgi:hypothetical protein